jgi:hypothetical protein
MEESFFAPRLSSCFLIWAGKAKSKQAHLIWGRATIRLSKTVQTLFLFGADLAAHMDTLLVAVQVCF